MKFSAVLIRTSIMVGVMCVSLVQSGCTHSQQYIASVNAFTDADSERLKRYVLVSGDDDVAENDFEFREYTEYVHRALQLRGYEQAAAPENAELVVALSYGIGPPKTHTYTYSVPHWGQIGYASSKTVGTATTSGHIATDGNPGMYSGNTEYSSTTTYEPEFGITSYSTEVRQYVTFTRTMRLVAFDAESVQKADDPVEVWRVKVASTGRSGDLRRAAPYLVAAMQPYIGQETRGGAVKVTLPENDRRVEAIRVREDDVDA